MARAASNGAERSAPVARRILRGAALLALVAGLLGGTRLAAALEELQFFRIGTAATTGTYFQVGGILASALSRAPGTRDCEHGGSCGVSGLVAVAQATQGSVQNVAAVSAGQLEAALAQSDIAYWGYIGATPTQHRCGSKEDQAARNSGTAILKSKGPLKNLRAIASLYPEDVHVVVRAESSIRSLRELKGKRVALGEPESGTLADARLVLEAAGLNECEIKAEYLRLTEATDALTQGRIDALFMVSGYPVPAITDVAATVPTRLLPIAPDVVDRLVRKFSFMGADTIPGGSYPNIDEATPTVSTRALFIVRDDVKDDLVYAITKALWSDATRRLLETAHPAGKRIKLANAFDGVAIPFHPGAARFYREAGMKLPADTQ
jgi:TRAP transporter TAXI family solute receptor